MGSVTEVLLWLELPSLGAWRPDMAKASGPWGGSQCKPVWQRSDLRFLVLDGDQLDRDVDLYGQMEHPANLTPWDLNLVPFIISRSTQYF